MTSPLGVILGTAAYMSPAQAKGRVADKRSDVWAFGCVLFDTPYFSNVLGRPYDVSRDGKRFLMIKSAASSERPATPGMVVMTNWFEEVNAAIK